jgi:hypothetical protein
LPERGPPQYKQLNPEAETKNFSGTNGELVASHLDLTNLRWQMIAGFTLACLAVLLCELLRPPDFVTSDLPFVSWAAASVAAPEQLARIGEAFYLGVPTGDPFTLMSLTLDSLLWHQNLSGYLLTNFLIRGLVMLLVALVVLELTGLSGNRGGSAGAVWAALLFAVVPNGSFSLFLATSRQPLFGALFLLATIFFWLRYRLVQERGYRHFALLCFIFFICSTGIAVIQSTTEQGHLPNFLKEVTRHNALFVEIGLIHGRLLSTKLVIAYSLSCLLFLIRLLNGWLSKEGIVSVICLAVPILLPYFCSDSCAPLLITYSSIALSMLLPILSLPIVDRINRKSSLLLSAIGTLALIVTFLCWCAAFEDQSLTLQTEAESFQSVRNRPPFLSGRYSDTIATSFRESLAGTA